MTGWTIGVCAPGIGNDARPSPGAVARGVTTIVREWHHGGVDAEILETRSVGYTAADARAARVARLKWAGSAFVEDGDVVVTGPTHHEVSNAVWYRETWLRSWWDETDA